MVETVKVNSGETIEVDSIISDIQSFMARLSITNPNIGQIRLAQVIRADPVNKLVEMYVLSDKQDKISAVYPGIMFDDEDGSGIWYGLQEGDIVICGIGYGNKYFILNKIGNPHKQVNSLASLSIDDITGAFSNVSSTDTADVDFRSLSSGAFMIKTKDSASLKLIPNTQVSLGKRTFSSIFMDLQSSSFTNEADNAFEFLNSGFSIKGVITRDRRSNIDASQEYTVDPRIEYNWQNKLDNINFDPKLEQFQETKGTNFRNPPLVENRKIIFEFADDFGIIESDQKEVKKAIANNTESTKTKLTSRRAKKNDALSLSLISPNYLIESIEGTVVDIFGNVLDINRNILPLGIDTYTLNGTENNFKAVRGLHRKGIAFHWEMNARKDPDSTSIESNTGTNYANIDGIYKRNRSRFSFDVDKEGQFKLNVPCSSETGNVPLFTRYENYSTINPNQSNGSPDYDYFSTNDKKIDILLDSFCNTGCVDIKGNDKLIPNDRVTNTPIKLGTVYHNIALTCIEPINSTPISNANGIFSGPDLQYESFTPDKTKKDILINTGSGSVVTSEVYLSGDKANAGGRSGTANFDGMLNVSIGANTVDRQSLWLDTQGGIVSRIGQDLNSISLLAHTDGDVYFQVGNPLYNDNDNRYTDATKNNNIQRAKRFEIRVLQGGNGQYARILIDNKGILITSPSDIEFRSDTNLILSAGGSIVMNGELVSHYNSTPKAEVGTLYNYYRDFESAFEPDQGRTDQSRYQGNTNNPTG